MRVQRDLGEVALFASQEREVVVKLRVRVHTRNHLQRYELQLPMVDAFLPAATICLQATVPPLLPTSLVSLIQIGWSL